MDRYGYVLKNRQKEAQPGGRYHRTELELMTTYHLRELCRKEKIIQGVINPMDKEELIRVIIRYRGADEYYLIRSYDEKGMEALDRLMVQTRISYRQEAPGSYSSRITVWEGLALGFYDGLTLPYQKEMAGTNALIVGGDGQICAILNVEARGNSKDCLYLTKAAGLPCRESEIKDYSLYCLDRRGSELLFRVYNGKCDYIPENLEVWRIPLLDFIVRKPVLLTLPLAIDFGSVNTTAGVYLDNAYFEKSGIEAGERGLLENQVNYAVFYEADDTGRETALLPSVVGVLSLEGEQPEFLFGHEAVSMANRSYIDEGFCIFYDIKRWIWDCEKQEEIMDRQGRRMMVLRKQILKAYLDYVISEVRNRFKCEISAVHISSPVKQKRRFQTLFRELLPEYAVEEKDMIDEGVAVLYHTIADMIAQGTLDENEEYRALVIDCGGGTTDISSCVFRVKDCRAAYQIDIETAYENGDADFGGNNLTYRIMQLLKIAVVNELGQNGDKTVKQLLERFDIDIFRYVDQYGSDRIYEELEAEYAMAEETLPTKFKEYENRSRIDYYKVKNNFYFLFGLAESIKKEFYKKVGTLRVVISSTSEGTERDVWLEADKWKLSVWHGERLETVREFPRVGFSIYDMELLLKADIYGMIHKFMEPMYEDGRLEDYSIMKLTGQSCKIDLFRDSLKEFVPGRTIQFKRKNGDGTNELGLKLTCIDGALEFLRDKKYGFADIRIRTAVPAFPYQITAYTHNGEELLLIDGLNRQTASGMVSRNMEDLTLKLCLKDMGGSNRYSYTCYCPLSSFEQKRYEEIQAVYGDHIPQADTDDITEGEVRFFVWAEPNDWAFRVVPVYRKQEELYLGGEELFGFENDCWVRNIYDGMR